MKTRHLIFAFFSMVLLALPVAAAQLSSGASAETARAIVQELADHRFAAVEARFDKRMQAALPRDRLAAVWKSLEEQVGQFRRIRGVVFAGRGAPTAILVCQFEHADLDAVLVFGAGGRLAGLHFRPSRVTPWNPPAYARPKHFIEEPVTVKTGRWALPGTLTLPKGRGPFPAVVLVQGSGPQDQDETTGAEKPFKDLAWGLANRSVAVLRYTKRTRQYGVASSSDFAKFTVNDETVDDARSAVALLSKRPEIDPHRIFVLGHSLGATLAPRIATGDQSVAGIILMAGAITPMEKLAIEQARTIAALEHKAPDVARKEIAQIQAEASRIESPNLKPGIMVNFLGAQTPATYWLDLRTYRPGRVAAALRIPTLVLQGGRDYQVPPGELAKWQKALAGHGNATFHLFPSLNHLFIAGTAPSTPAEYLRPGHLDAQVIGVIADWISAMAESH